MRFLMVACLLSVCCAADAGTIRVRFEAEFDGHLDPALEGFDTSQIHGLYEVDVSSSTRGSKRLLVDGPFTRWQLRLFEIRRTSFWNQVQIAPHTAEVTSSQAVPNFGRLYSYRVLGVERESRFLDYGNYPSEADLPFWIEKAGPGCECGAVNIGGDSFAISRPLFALEFVGPHERIEVFGRSARPPMLEELNDAKLSIFLSFYPANVTTLTYNIISLQVVPEPSTTILLLTAPALLVSERRRHA